MSLLGKSKGAANIQKKQTFKGEKRLWDYMGQEENYYSQIKPENVWLFPKVSSHKQRRYYNKESLVHPAKMPTFFVQKIINEYSKPGKTITLTKEDVDFLDKHVEWSKDE